MKIIEWKNNSLYILDQSKLPWKEEWINCQKYQQVIDAIKKLKIRGAPAIGVAAAYGVALAAIKYTGYNLPDYIQNVISEFALSRPTAVNLFVVLKRQGEIVLKNRNKSSTDLKLLLLEEAKKIEEEERERSQAIANYGADLVPPKANILTHCNTGSLATIGLGTALGIIKEVWYRRRDINMVYFTETRPLLQGSRLTGWELAMENIPATLITDNMAGYLMSKGMIDLVIVGADRITLNGDTANKIGTYTLAVLAKHHNIPFYVAAPLSSFDFKLEKGSDIVIEERDPEEVLSVAGKRIAPEGINAINPAFDVTPNDLISAIITEKGIILPPFRENIERFKEEDQ
ncbi:MAG: S-methyl-5-thioribose-1-phosphate isomerase [Dictyoglomus sp. NZ13-RE01]|nr:MAG: S-methyl-5-thioribose-1-phosphate isomerase [Dictyoglomus sp. NZ13-RE01]